MEGYLQILQELLKSGQPAVSVILVETAGSTPQDAGSKMLIAAQGRVFGSIGGGQMEALAIETAQTMITESAVKPLTQFLEWHLQKDAGMTCGGTIKLYFERINPPPWTLAVFGAGHLAQVLIPLLLNLDCHIKCFDSRQEWLAKFLPHPKLMLIHSENLVAEVKTLPETAFVLLMTQGHATDRPLLQEFLETRQPPYLGVIGSAAKAAILRRELRERGVPEDKCQNFICPLGLPLGSNHPYEIAISIVAQLLQVRDQR